MADVQQSRGRKKPIQPRSQRYSLSVKYRDVLFPFEPIEFISGLPDRGWVLQDAPSRVGVGMNRYDVDGRVAGKGSLEFNMHTQRFIVAIGGSNIEDTLSEFDDFEELVRKRMSVNSPEHAAFYELSAHVVFETKASPLAYFTSHTTDIRGISDLSDFLGNPPMLYGMRIAAHGRVPSDTEWTEIHYGPHIQQPTTRLGIDVVARRSQRKDFTRLVNDLSGMMLRLVGNVEGE